MKCLLPLALISSISLSVFALPEDLRIVRVNPGTDEVAVLNTSTGTTTVASTMDFCHIFNYASSIVAGTVFAPGEEKTFSVTGLNDAASDLWLYRGTSGFGNAANIVSGLQYGGPANIGRTGLAKTAGLWADPVAPVPPVGLAIEFQGADPAAFPTSGSDWAVDAPTFPAAPTPDPSTVLGLVCVADGPALLSPLGLQQAADDDRIFIYDQNGKVLILRNGVLEPTPFLDVTSLLVGVLGGYSERGLLGFCLHPDFPADRRVYTYTSQPAAGTADFQLTSGSVNHQSFVTEWQVSAANPDVVDPLTRRVILTVEQPFSNHNGGEIVFGPDGMMYIAFGDGGGGGDPLSAGQDLTTILGSIVRIDPFGSLANGEYSVPNDNPFVGVAGVVQEIYAYGFRNPYRMSFDRSTGDFYTGDVGQREIEEVDLVVSGGNYGWAIKEGSLYYNQATTAVATVPFPGITVPPNLIDPIAEYDHDEGISVIGGYVGRDGSRPDLEGLYVFGEYQGRIFILRNGVITEPQIGADDRSVGMLIKGFGQDAAGDIYVLASNSGTPVGNGKVLKIAPLAHINNIEVDTQVELNFTIDPSIVNPTVEDTTALLLSNTVWTPVASALISPGSNGTLNATFPVPPGDHHVFRVVE